MCNVCLVKQIYQLGWPLLLGLCGGATSAKVCTCDFHSFCMQAFALSFDMVLKEIVNATNGTLSLALYYSRDRKLINVGAVKKF